MRENTVATTCPISKSCSRLMGSQRAFHRWGQSAGKNSPAEENETVDTDQDVAIGVDFQEVSKHGVKHKPPEDQSKEISKEFLDSFSFSPLKHVR